MLTCRTSCQHEHFNLMGFQLWFSHTGGAGHRWGKARGCFRRLGLLMLHLSTLPLRGGSGEPPQPAGAFTLIPP